MNPIIEQSRAAVQRFANMEKNSIGGSALDHAMLAAQVNAECMARLGRDKDGNISSSNPGLDLASCVIPILVHDLPALHALVGDGPATDGRVVVVSSQFVRNNRRLLETQPDDYQPWVATALLCAAQRAVGLPGSDGAKLVNPYELLSAMGKVNSLALVGLDQPVGSQVLAEAMDAGRDWKDTGDHGDPDGLGARWQEVRSIAQDQPGRMPSVDHYAYSRLSVLHLAANQRALPIEEQISQASSRTAMLVEFMAEVGTVPLIGLLAEPMLEHEPAIEAIGKKISLARKVLSVPPEGITESLRKAWISGLSSVFDVEKNVFVMQTFDECQTHYGFSSPTVASCLSTDAVDHNLLSIAIAEKLLSSSDYADAFDFITQVQDADGDPSRYFVNALRLGQFTHKNYPDQVSLERHFACSALNAMDAGGFEKAWSGSGGYTSAPDAGTALSEALEAVVVDFSAETSPLVRQSLAAVSQTYPESQAWFDIHSPAQPKKACGPS